MSLTKVSPALGQRMNSLIRAICSILSVDTFPSVSGGQSGQMLKLKQLYFQPIPDVWPTLPPKAGPQHYKLIPHAATACLVLRRPCPLTSRTWSQLLETHLQPVWASSEGCCLRFLKARSIDESISAETSQVCSECALLQWGSKENVLLVRPFLAAAKRWSRYWLQIAQLTASIQRT